MGVSSTPKSKVIIVDGYGVDVRVDSGHLIIRNGTFGSGDEKVIRTSRGRAAFDRLLILSHDGNFSLAALDWCHRMGVTVAIIGSDNRLINCLIPRGAPDGPIKRAQAISGMTDDAIRLARWILDRKIQSQIYALQSEPVVTLTSQSPEARDRTLRELRALVQTIPADGSLDSLLSHEAVAAQRYWQIITGLTLPWPTWALKLIPEHWARTWPRDSGGRSRVRDARDVFNACINYGYTLAEIEMRVACVAYGLDPDFGLLHVDDRLRESFLYDILESLRATVDVLTLEFIYAKGLRPFMFHELRNGVARLDPDFTKPFALALMPKLRRPTLELAAAYVAQLRRVKVPYRLTRFEAAAKLEHVDVRVRPKCGYCHQPLFQRGLKFCGRRCYLRHSVEVRQPLKLAQERLAELRAQGISPGHGGEAARKRGARIAESNRRRRGETREAAQLDDTPG